MKFALLLIVLATCLYHTQSSPLPNQQQHDGNTQFAVDVVEMDEADYQEQEEEEDKAPIAQAHPEQSKEIPCCKICHQAGTTQPTKPSGGGGSGGIGTGGVGAGGIGPGASGTGGIGAGGNGFGGSGSSGSGSGGSGSSNCGPKKGYSDKGAGASGRQRLHDILKALLQAGSIIFRDSRTHM